MPKDIKSILTIYHRQGLSAQEAHEAILRFPGEDFMSLQDVEHIFKEIEVRKNREQKEKKKKQEIENQGKQTNLNELMKYFEAMKLESEELEENVLEERRVRMMLALKQKSVHERIMKYTTIGARIALLKTSQLLRQLSNDTPYYIDTFTIEFGDDYFKILVDKPEQYMTGMIRERDSRKGTVPVGRPIPKKYTKEERAARRDPYYRKAEVMLKRLFRFEKLKIGTLTLQPTHFRGIQGDGGINEAVENALSSRTTLMEVESLVIGGSGSDTLEKLLPFVDPSCFRTIKFDGGSKYEPSVLFFEESIFQSAQWKNATEFFMKYVGVDEENWKPYAHFSDCKLQFYARDINIGRLFELKDELLKNPRLQQFKIVTPYLKIKNFRKLTEAFQVFNPKTPTLIHFDYPGGEKKLSVVLTERYIWFKGPEYVENAGADSDDEVRGDDSDDED
ncbi:unnamed protein product [Caenorhabditis brenneri]